MNLYRRSRELCCPSVVVVNKSQKLAVTFGLLLAPTCVELDYSGKNGIRSVLPPPL